MSVNQAKLQEFMGKALGDMGAAASAVMVLIGDQLGLYKTLAEEGPATAAELAKRTGTSERYVREWLCNQAAGGYVAYEPEGESYHLPEEQKMALAQADSPVYIPGAFQVIKAMFMAEPTIARHFRTGKGMRWGDHHPCLFEGTERFFRPSYLSNLTAHWIPALDGVEAKLRAGARVADVGCGLGASTILMAKAYPRSRFFGFDYHPRSIRLARERARKAGVLARANFRIAKSTSFPGKDYDLVAHFDCLHDMGDPLGAARHVLKTLSKDGTWLVVEPFAEDHVEKNLNPVGRMFYAASTMLCVPNSLAENGPALGAQAGEARLCEIVHKAGFTRFRRAAQTPFNLILEARP
jgi:SAM-dependent methyltransferase